MVVFIGLKGWCGLILQQEAAQCSWCSICTRSPGVTAGLISIPNTGGHAGGAVRMMTILDYPRLLCRCASRFLSSSCVCVGRSSKLQTVSFCNILQVSNHHGSTITLHVCPPLHHHTCMKVKHQLRAETEHPRVQREAVLIVSVTADKH